MLEMKTEQKEYTKQIKDAIFIIIGGDYWRNCIFNKLNMSILKIMRHNMFVWKDLKTSNISFLREIFFLVWVISQNLSFSMTMDATLNQQVMEGAIDRVGASGESVGFISRDPPRYLVTHACMVYTQTLPYTWNHFWASQHLHLHLSA